MRGRCQAGASPRGATQGGQPSGLRAPLFRAHCHHHGGEIVAQFREGHRKVGGRAKGTLNKATLVGRAFAERLVNDPDYLASVEARAKAGKLQPGIEQMIWYYAIGKPRESLELSGNIGSGRDVATMSTAELLDELEQHQLATAAFLSQHRGQQHTPGD